jgi:hypothetical protein
MWFFRNARPGLELLSASAIGVFLILNPLLRVTSPSEALGQAANQSVKQPAGKTGGQAAPQGRAAVSSTLTPPRPGWSYPQRQTLTYEVDWRVFPAGTAVLHMESNGDSQRVTVTGDSSGAFNLLFRVSDHFQSTFSRQTGCSSGFAKQLMQGSHQVNAEQQFSSGQSRFTDDEKTLISHSHQSGQIPIPSCVSDPLSAIFYAASQPLQTGQRFSLPVVYGPNLLEVAAHVEGQEAVRTPSTTYQALRVQPTWTNPAVGNSGNIWVWYSDDDRHIPVQIRARLFWGTITFRLTSLEQK